ncbi:MAG: valine--tRNA ligase [Oscillospiraceae bacterium]|nr:valine--tRNA ligase [Oscillospiraceae bacterium]
MAAELAKQYEPAEVEGRIYSEWLEKGYFRAEKREGSKGPYTISMPPPNITGQLHLGHCMYTMQDALIRWRRMQGYDALWLPGTDHAAIATEVKIVEQMAKEGLSKEALGYEKFMERAWAWKETYGGRIVEQLKLLGSSCDWSRERFTMDEGCSKAVKEVFVRLYEKGLIYRGERIINWCVSCGTSISDAEVEHSERDGAFWHIRYPYADGTGHIEIATTRPETLLGDTAVAVHPDDPRYAEAIGRELILPLTGRNIPVIADSYVEMDFGTGAVKITPAHDPNDFEVGARHGLPILNVMTDDGHMNAQAGAAYEGMDRFACRKQLVKDLEALGLLIKVEPMKHSVGECYRCHTVAEPRVSTQWFVRMKPLAEPAIAAVKSGETKFVPARFEKTYMYWMENIKDWCISRQLWWGHRIPAYYCGACGEMAVTREAPEKCAGCGGDMVQDPDSLDTWFSSALWPFSTLGWPDDTEDLKYFYPTNTLCTAYDIIFFWVARMIFSGCEFMGKAPFDTVLITGLIRDELGRKLSKSLGNGADPVEVIQKYGADALRFTLTTGNSPGNDLRFSEEKVSASRNFANKIWNASRFVRMNLDEDEPAPHVPGNLNMEDQWILSRYNTTVREVTANLEKFELGMAVQKLYDFLWDEFCDWYIELAKISLTEPKTRAVLVYVLSGTLKLLHPFMPFITEEIWRALPHEGESIMISDWPVYDEALSFPGAEARMAVFMEAVKGIRNRRAEMNVPPGKKTNVFIRADDTFSDLLFVKLANASAVHWLAGRDYEKDDAVRIVGSGFKIWIPMGELVDPAAEKARLEKELAHIEKQLQGVNAKLSNEGFTGKAPAAVIEGARQNARQLAEKRAALRESLAALGGTV